MISRSVYAGNWGCSMSSAIDVVRALVARSGVGARELSRRMGRNQTYIGVITSKQTRVGAGLLARVADACGCDLVVVDKATGERVARVDPAD